MIEGRRPIITLISDNLSVVRGIVSTDTDGRYNARSMIVGYVRILRDIKVRTGSSTLESELHIADR